ncbi:MAG: hypothetical protein WBA97_26420 [Actinophytocola sp.]|uniref:hypothetical protein n=1 Tax=Actinophytocola sp. TaxID=1872138 RepID=UPI003C73E14C
MHALGAVLAVAGTLLLSGAPSAAAQPPTVIEQLEQNRIVRLPGAVATLDDARVLAGLPANGRVLLAPTSGLPDLGALRSWAHAAGVGLTVVEGLWIESPLRKLPLATADENTLRRVLTTHDVTDAVLGKQSPAPATVPATAAQLDQLPVSRPRAGVRVARSPEPFVDYASGLAARSPGVLIVVAHGDWLEFAGPGADQAEHARDATYGPALLNRGRPTDVVDTVLARLAEPARPIFDLPRPERFEFKSVVMYVAAGTAAATIGMWLLFLYLRRTLRRLDAGVAMREERAEAYLRLEELGDLLIEVESNGQAVDPRIAERLATARTLFDQAHTPEAMAAVREIADEGLSAGREEKR